MNEKSLALGTFDGLHTGHLQVIKQAKDSRYEPCVLLFDVHPLSVITGKAPCSLISDEMRKEIIESLGVKVIDISFAEIADMPYDEFFKKYLVEKYHAKALSCGENYTFGAGGKGDVEKLKALCGEYGVELHIAPTQTYKGETVSSTKIRSLLENGSIEDANAMLGREFSYRSAVVDGDRRGRTLGFPTANQYFPDNFVKLKFGVYASKAVIDGEIFPSVTNIGIRPTVYTERYRSETYIINFQGNIYGKKIEVRLTRFLRPEKKFATLSELSRAIEHDSKKSQEIFSDNSCII